MPQQMTLDTVVDSPEAPRPSPAPAIHLGKADSLNEYVQLFKQKHGRWTTAKEQLKWMDEHEEQMERDFPGYKNRCRRFDMMARKAAEAASQPAKVCKAKSDEEVEDEEDEEPEGESE